MFCFGTVYVETYSFPGLCFSFANYTVSPCANRHFIKCMLFKVSQMADSRNQIYRKQNFLGEYITNTTCKEGIEEKKARPCKLLSLLEAQGKKN